MAQGYIDVQSTVPELLGKYGGISMSCNSEIRARGAQST